MKYTVRYQSRGGNTRAVAETIAEILGVSAESVDTPLKENVDMLFIGGGVYMWACDRKLREFLETIDPETVGTIIPFGSSGGQNVVIAGITKYAANKGIHVDEHTLCLRMGLQGHHLLGRKGGTLNSKQLQRITDFTNTILKHNH